jgi:exodeoxyribonuclease VII large subunit
MQENSSESPASVRFVTEGIKAHIEKLGHIWLEGEVAQLTERSGATAYIRLKDLNEDMSIQVAVYKNVLAQVKPLSENARIVVLAKPSWWVKNGSLSMQASEIREVGIGELLARLEALKNKLAAEGLFDLSRKIALPMLPRKVGIICGKNTDAEKDVVENARRRWPAVQFEVREVTVQGQKAVKEVSQALADLEAMADVDVIVITRGGGSFEDLLPFSDESLIRLASSCTTPIVSAIGHEKDSPLLDLVADYRASTPTDAGKRIVPDIAQEISDISKLQDRALRALLARIEAESAFIAQLRSRPIMKDPMVFVTTRIDELKNLRERSLRSFATTIDAERKELKAITAHIRSLSPQSTLDRGYAVVRDGKGDVVRDPKKLKSGDALTIKVAKGETAATVN